MSAQHTPGPWMQNPAAPHEIGMRRDDNTIYPALVARVTATLDHPAGNANARLIAAAPDMLEALEAFVEGFDPDMEYDATDTAYIVFGEKAKLARAAIAKARGEAA